MIPCAGDVYRHFKGDYYVIVGVAMNTETEEYLVIYKKEGDFKLWARPLDMFLSKVDHEKYPEVEQQYRFEKINEKEEWI